ncbi:DNA polymerase III subunit psi [Salmonella enterica subsp. enterica serovar Choleraesuis]|nr:DNA polymerase III subunit psi [Salmonella enterica subsp. enterica serovar Choleraesuis]
MTSRRDWQLQQLGITRWSLRRPAVLQGEIALSISSQTRLIIIADQLPELHEPLISDVLQSLGLDASQVMVLTPERAAMLPDGAHCNSWWLGCDGSAPLSGASIHSPALAGLLADGAQRRALWQQICEYEDDFFTQPG